MVGAGLSAEFEWDRNLNQFVTTVDNVNDLVSDIQTQVSNQIPPSLPPSLSSDDPFNCLTLSFQASSYDQGSVSSNLTALADAISDPNIGVGLQALMNANSDLDTVFNTISNQASLGDLSPVVNTARSIELARYIVHCRLHSIT